MAALPLGVATGIVAGRLTRAAAPGTIGEPIPNARVTLTPEFGIAAAPHASPPVLILPDPVHCTTDETGLLLGERTLESVPERWRQEVADLLAD